MVWWGSGVVGEWCGGVVLYWGSGVVIRGFVEIVHSIVDMK